MQREGLNIADDHISFPRRSKRLNDHSNDDSSLKVNGKAFESVKKQRGIKLMQDSLSSIADKENFHRSRHLAPRSRATRVLSELLVDAQTDASDFELSDYDDEGSSPLGILFNQQLLRVEDPSNDRYNFKVFEDCL